MVLNLQPIHVKTGANALRMAGMSLAASTGGRRAGVGEPKDFHTQPTPSFGKGFPIPSRNGMQGSAQRTQKTNQH